MWVDCSIMFKTNNEMIATVASGNNSNLSWKCPGHVLDMSLGQGHVLKSQGQKGGPLPTL